MELKKIRNDQKNSKLISLIRYFFSFALLISSLPEFSNFLKYDLKFPNSRIRSRELINKRY